MQSCDIQAAITQGIKVAMASMGNGKAGGKGGSKAGGDKGKGGGKGKGDSKGKGKGKDPKVCGRCGSSDHHKSHCWCLTDNHICSICQKPGHVDHMCTSTTMVKDQTCGCCGGLGHPRRNCPTWNTVCGLCGKTGHHDHLCHQHAQLAQQNQTWADKAKAAAPLKQPPGKAKMLTLDDKNWTAYCIKCDGGFNDPEGNLKNCPFCKSDLIAAGGKKATTTPSPFGALSQQTIQCQLRLDNVGPDGLAPKTQEDKEKEDKIANLKQTILTLESLDSTMGDYSANIKELQKQIKELERKQVSPEVQLLKDHSAIHYSLAELEQKHNTIKQQLQDKIAKEVQKRTEATTRGDQKIKDVEEEFRAKLQMAKEVKAQLEAQADEAITTTRQKLADHVKEAKLAIEAFGAKSAPIMQKVAATAAAKTGTPAANMAIAPGQIVHSNHLSAQSFLNAFGEMPGLTIQPDMVQQLAQACIQVVGSQAVQVPASSRPAQTPPQPQEPAQMPVIEPPAPGVQSVASQEVIQVDHETAAMDDAHLTDISDSDAETPAAGEPAAAEKKKKRGAKEAKKEKERKKAAASKPQVPVQKPGKK